MQPIQVRISKEDKVKFSKLQEAQGMSYQDLLKWLIHVGLKYADKEKMDVA